MRFALGVVALLSLAAVPAQAERTKLAVLPTQFDKGSEGMVPKLFDEYVLAAAQNAGDYDVIGQDDIAALVGFERQKDMLGCDDASCIANIGGALGVDRVIAIKIARLDPDWVVTSKLINIKATRVEARTTDMVAGNVKALLNAVPSIMTHLFDTAQGRASGARPPAAVTTPKVAPATLVPAATAATTAPGVGTPPAAATTAPNPSVGRGSRIVGIVLTISGIACAAVSLAYGYMIDDVTETTDTTFGTTSTTSDSHILGTRAGVIAGAGFMILTGVGSGMYLNGKARAATGDDEASGHVWYRWVGWTMLAATAVAPFAVDTRDKAVALGAAGIGLSSLLFGLSMGSSSAHAHTSRGGEVPLAGMTLMRYGEQAVPALALRMPL